MKSVFPDFECPSFLDRAQNLYEIDHITEIEITFEEDNWDGLMDANYGSEEIWSCGCYLKAVY